MKFQDVDIYGTLRITGSFQVPYGYGTGSYPQNPTSGSLFLDTSMKNYMRSEEHTSELQSR